MSRSELPTRLPFPERRHRDTFKRPLSSVSNVRTLPIKWGIFPISVRVIIDIRLLRRTYAGFFVHLNSIPPVLRWLQWLCPLKYTLEALSVNEVGSGLMIKDTLEGVPVNVSASLIMQLVRAFLDPYPFLSPLTCSSLVIRIRSQQLLQVRVFSVFSQSTRADVKL